MSGSPRRKCILACLALLLAFTGCDGTDGPQLPLTHSGVWKIPAEGTSIPSPRALHAARQDVVYALDDAGRILIYEPTGKLRDIWWMPDYDVGRAEGIVQLLDGRIAVADTHYHRIVFFHPDGAVESMLGTQGVEPGQFVYPVAVTQDPEGFIYVGEYGDRQRIQKFTNEGEFVLQFGSHGTEPGQFQRPSGIVWRDGRVYAVDAFNNRIQVFTDRGEFERVLAPPDNSGGLKYPYDATIGPDGNLYIVENLAGRVTAMTPDGSLIGRFGSPGRTSGTFFNPWGIAVLSDGRILVADTGNHRIVELTP